MTAGTGVNLCQGCCFSISQIFWAWRKAAGLRLLNLVIHYVHQNGCLIRHWYKIYRYKIIVCVYLLQQKSHKSWQWRRSWRFPCFFLPKLPWSPVYNSIFTQAMFNPANISGQLERHGTSFSIQDQAIRCVLCRSTRQGLWSVGQIPSSW